MKRHAMRDIIFLLSILILALFIGASFHPAEEPFSPMVTQKVRPYIRTFRRYRDDYLKRYVNVAYVYLRKYGVI